jgi:hypothetical protein
MIDVDEEELTVEEAVRIQHDVFPIGCFEWEPTGPLGGGQANPAPRGPAADGSTS